MLNPTEGHIEEIAENADYTRSIREDKKQYQPNSNVYKYDSVNPGFINCVLNPEYYYSRRPNLGFKSSAIRSSMEVPVYVNASGNGACYVLPNNLVNYLEGAFMDSIIPPPGSFFGG